jgi:hypothetical protein
MFDRDAETNKGYYYTKSVRLSCRKLKNFGRTALPRLR